MSTELAVIEQVSPATLFGTSDAKAIVAGATDRADALAGVIRAKGLSVSISGREYVKVEGWTLLGTMLGVFPVCTWTRRVEAVSGSDGWEARVEARTLGDQLVGAAEAQCCRDEETWKRRSDFALRSMAQTRATSKALRLPLGFVMSLAGYEPTPYEEMTEAEREDRRAVQAPPRPQPPTPIRDGEVDPRDQQPNHDPTTCIYCGGVAEWTNKKAGTSFPDYKCAACGGSAWGRTDALRWSQPRK